MLKKKREEKAVNSKVSSLGVSDKIFSDEKKVVSIIDCVIRRKVSYSTHWMERRDYASSHSTMFIVPNVYIISEQIISSKTVRESRSGDGACSANRSSPPPS